MNNCKDCKYWNDALEMCVHPYGENCKNSSLWWHKEPQTNSDRFRAMSDMEIASFFYWDVDGSGKTQWQWLEWLRQECE